MTMKWIYRKEISNLWTGIRLKLAFRPFIFLSIIFFAITKLATAGILNPDTIPKSLNLPELQGMNKIDNAATLTRLKNKIKRSDTVFRLIKVLHIGDSHIKAGFLAETFINGMNEWYAQTLHYNVFFNGQSFCKTGTKYSDYYSLAELDKQLLMDKPDLVIISLGTNDAFSGSSRYDFYDKIHHLATKIKTLSPGSELILTTPPDALKKNKTNGRYESLPDLQYVVSVIIQYANDHHLAYWNLHQVMGGNYSINTWVAKKLAATDRVHFTEQGYTIIGEWLFNAVKNCL